MSSRRNDPDGGGWIAALLFIAVFFAFILLWQALKFLGAAFVRQPKNPILWVLLAASVLLTLVAVASQGASGAVILAMASWIALIAVAATIARNAAQNPDEATGIHTALRNQWWD